MKEFDYRKIDAFTEGESMGNPAACIYMECDNEITNEEMLWIAKQHQGFVSEMVYCSPSIVADCKLVYYSSECEVDFCGHGTIAAMFEWVSNQPDLLAKKEIKIETHRKGILTLYNEIQENKAVYITAPEPEYLQLPVHSNQVADVLGIERTLLDRNYPLAFIDAGLRTLIVPFVSFEDTINLFPYEPQLKRFCLESGIDIILIFHRETQNKKAIAHTRVFAPKFGYLEDPATGSGNSALGYYFYQERIWDGTPVDIEQGGKNRIYNTVKLRWKDNCVLFGGSATLRIKGKYCL